jgi:hypothetical protein
VTDENNVAPAFVPLKIDGKTKRMFLGFHSKTLLGLILKHNSDGEYKLSAIEDESGAKGLSELLYGEPDALDGCAVFAGKCFAAVGVMLPEAPQKLFMDVNRNTFAPPDTWRWCSLYVLETAEDQVLLLDTLVRLMIGSSGEPIYILGNNPDDPLLTNSSCFEATVVGRLLDEDDDRPIFRLSLIKS